MQEATAIEFLTKDLIVDLSWELEPYTLTYEVGKNVSIDGTATQSSDSWWLIGDSLQTDFVYCLQRRF